MTSIGGQALMEGIMMRGPERTAMAVRNAKGEIVLEDFPTPVGKGKIRKLPFIRGIFNMISSLTLGYKCLMRSADIAISDAEEADRLEREKKLQDGNSEEPSQPDDGQKDGDSEEPSKPDGGPKDDNSEEPSQPDDGQKGDNSEEPSKPDDGQKGGDSEEPSKPDDGQKDDNSEEPSKPDDGQKGEKKNSSSLTTVVMVIGVVLGLALSIGLFIALPSYAFLGFSKLFNIDLENSGYLMSLFRSFFEGVLKIFILVLYMLIVSKMKDIHRTFMYHGAEHKTIFCYEQGLELTVENVRKQRRLHPRCGTSFLILVLIVSMFIGFFIPSFLPTYLRVIIKIALLPLTIGIGYELIKLAGRKNNLFTRITSAPGMWLQHITTKEPDDGMIECAIAAMNKVIPEDKEKDRW